MDCLVLTQGYEPCARVPWQRAITMFFNGVVEILEEYDRIIWRSMEKVIRMPSVVRILHEVRRKRSVKFSRESIYIRDKGRCQYCGLKVKKIDSTIDHVTPRSRGGKTIWTNVVTSCFDCNQKKRAKTPHEAGMKLLTEPIKPAVLPFVASLRHIVGRGPHPNIPKEWMSYIYWNVELEE